MASLIEPTDTMNITVHTTRQIQDEVELYHKKMSAATHLADQEYQGGGNTLVSSFRFIKNDLKATLQTFLFITAHIVRGFILVTILFIQSIIDLYQYYRHELLQQQSGGTGKTVKYKPPPKKQTFENDRSLLTIISGEPSSSAIESADGFLPWFKVLFPSCTNNSNHATGPSEDEWHDSYCTKESSIGDHYHDHDHDIVISQINTSLPSSSSSVSSKDSLATIITMTNNNGKRRRLFSVKRTKSEPTVLSPPAPLPLAVYSSRPFTTSNSLITSASQLPRSHSLFGSVLSLKLKQPGRRLSLLFKKSRKRTKNNT